MCDEGCAERRAKMIDAYHNAKIAQAIGHAVVGAAEMVGLKKKTAKLEYDSPQEKDKSERRYGILGEDGIDGPECILPTRKDK